MDENKLDKLREVGYEIKACCRLCLHGNFAPFSDFGTCAKHTYEHLKHTGEPRQLSIHRMGKCNTDLFQLNPDKMAELGTYGQFCLHGEK